MLSTVVTGTMLLVNWHGRPRKTYPWNNNRTRYDKENIIMFVPTI